MYLISIVRLPEEYAELEGRITVMGQIDFKKENTSIFPNRVVKCGGKQALHNYVDYIVEESEKEIGDDPEFKETHEDQISVLQGCLARKIEKK